MIHFFNTIFQALSVFVYSINSDNVLLVAGVFYNHKGWSGVTDAKGG